MGKQTIIKRFDEVKIIAKKNYDAPTPKAAKISKWILWGGTILGLLNTGAVMFSQSNLPGIPENWTTAIAWSVPVTAFAGYVLDYFKEKKHGRKKKEKVVQN